METNNVNQLETIKLSSFGEQIEKGFEFVFRRYDVSLLMLISALLPALLLNSLPQLVNVAESRQIDFETLVKILGYCVSFLTLIFGTVVWYVASSREHVTIENGFAFVFKNIPTLISLALLSAAVVYGALPLLIVPGIVLGLSLLLVFPVYVNEGITGFAALARSYELTYGYRWLLFRRFGLVIVCAIFFVLLSSAFGEDGLYVAALFQTMMGLVGYVMLSDFYLTLSQRTPSVIAPMKLIKNFAIVGLVIIAGLLILAAKS